MLARTAVSRIAQAAFLASALVLAGCGTNVHFVNQPAPPLPNVLPDPEEFKLTLSVINETNNTFPVGALKVKIAAQYFTTFTSGACTNSLDIPLGNMVPDQKITMQAVSFHKNAFTGDPCRCLINSCEGHVLLSLTNAAGTLKPGPKTKFQITWKKSGSLAELSVVDQSD